MIYARRVAERHAHIKHSTFGAHLEAVDDMERRTDGGHLKPTSSGFLMPHSEKWFLAFNEVENLLETV